MTYIAVAVYDLEGVFRGYTTLNNEVGKLKSTNLWSEEELPKLVEQLDRLNVGNVVTAHWPSIDDPEVLALLNDATWEPLEMEMADVVDDEHSYYVWTEVPETDAFGAPTGRMITGDIDREASVIAFKKALVPKEPVKAQIRTRKAQELVARRRAGV